jgi:hypothetical protein
MDETDSVFDGIGLSKAKAQHSLFWLFGMQGNM